MTKFGAKRKSTDSAKNEESAKVETTTRKIRRRFEDHTQSSLMKRKEPMKKKEQLTKCSLTNNMTISKKLTGSIIPNRLNGVCKKQSEIAKQNKNMQMLKTILKREIDRRASDVLRDELVTIRRPKRSEENLLILLQDNLVKDFSHELKGCMRTPIKLVAFENKLTEIFYESKQCTENSLDSIQDSVKDASCDLTRHAKTSIEMIALQDDTVKVVDRFKKHEDQSCASLRNDLTKEISGSFYRYSVSSPILSLRDNSPRKMHDSPENHSFVENPHKLQMSDKAKFLNREIDRSFRHKSKRGEHRRRSDEILLEENCPLKNEMHRKKLPTNLAIRKCTKKTWLNEEIAISKGEVADVTRTCNFNLQGATNTKTMQWVNNKWKKSNRAIINGSTMSNQKPVLQKSDFISNQQVWKPPGINRTTAENRISVQPMQKLLRPDEKSMVSMKNQHQGKYSSTKRIDESVKEPVLTMKSKVMKENRDPGDKIYKHLTKAEQQPELQNERALPKRRRSRTKIVSIPPSNSQKTDDSKISSNNANLVRSKSRSKLKSRYWQTGSIMPKEVSKTQNNIDQHHQPLTPSKRSKHAEVMHTLKKIINITREDNDIEENIIDICKNEVSSQETDNRYPLLSNYSTSSRRESLSSDDKSSCTKSKDLNNVNQFFSYASLKSTSTQTSLNTSLSLKDDFKENFNSNEIMKSTQTVGTQTSTSYNEKIIKVECGTMPYNPSYKDAMISCDLIGSNLKVDINSSASKDTLTSENFLTHMTKSLSALRKEEIYQDEIYLNSLIKCNNWMKIDADKFQEPTACYNNHNKDDDSVDSLSPEKSRPSLSIYSYDASCSDNSEEIIKYPENNAQYKDVTTPALTVKNIPSDVIAAFQLATERVNNLYKAVILYNENLKSKESEEHTKEATQSCETLFIRKDQCNIQKCASFMSCKSESGVESKHDIKYPYFTCKELPTLSYISDDSEELYDPDYKNTIHSEKKEINEKENNQKVIVKSISDGNFDFVFPNRLLVRRTQEEYALEILKLERSMGEDDENFELGRRASETLALTAIEKASIMSYERIFYFIYGFLCSMFCCLLFSFTYDSTT